MIHVHTATSGVRNSKKKLHVKYSLHVVFPGLWCSISLFTDILEYLYYSIRQYGVPVLTVNEAEPVTL